MKVKSEVVQGGVLYVGRVCMYVFKGSLQGGGSCIHVYIHACTHVCMDVGKLTSYLSQ